MIYQVFKVRIIDVNNKHRRNSSERRDCDGLDMFKGEIKMMPRERSCR